MRSVNIAELKNHLSLYLKEVRDGEEILVCDRNVPVARIVPIRAEDYEEERLKLAAEGKIRLGSGEPLDDAFWEMPAPKLLMADIRRVMDEERHED